MRVLLPSSTLPQVMNRSRSLSSCCLRYARMSCWMSGDAWLMLPTSPCRARTSHGTRTRASEVPLPLLHLHAAGLVVVDDATLAFAGAREEHLLDQLGKRVGVRAYRAGEGIAA